MTVYDRERALQERLNSFFHKNFALPDLDYYSRLDRKALAGLKALLGDINNIFTMKICLEFGTWLGEILNLDAKTRGELRDSILQSQPNTNGFDLEIPEPVGVVAEVKCNVPINGGSVYGSAQRNGIVKDIDALMEGKSKSPIDPTNCLKFLVLLDTPEVRAATRHLVKNLKRHKEAVVFIEPGIKPDCRHNLYVVHVSES
ncbi:hypothetical protein [Pseudohongiella sp. O18]|uniref:hypothetical protein n=1 Tax=Pseudohongiella sp. O18 TaxID=2904248 RepID=UPI001F349419|nr:hypothetical protein [Pseudohongiella sp. O18]